MTTGSSLCTSQTVLLYCIVLYWWSLLPYALRLFQDLLHSLEFWVLLGRENADLILLRGLFFQA